MSTSVNERIFMLDCGRKYYTPAWICRLVDMLKAAGFNALSIHFSEDMGMRLASKKYPFLAGGDHTLCVYGAKNGCPEDDGKFYTQEEMADVVRYAQSAGLDVIPSLDSPGHMNYVVKKYNEHFKTDIGNYFHKDGKISIVQGSSYYKDPVPMSYSRGVDIVNPEARAFALDLYEEYGKFFRSLGCTKFDIGGDELLGFGETIDDTLSKWQNLDHWRDHARLVTGNENAVAYDAFVLYVNELCALVRSLGYTSVRMWNDDAYRSFDTGYTGVTTLDPEIEMQYWLPTANDSKNTPAFYVEKGHALYNFNHYYTYYTLGFGSIHKVTPEMIEEKFDAYTMDHEHPENNLKAPHPAVKGGGYCLWSDTPGAETEDEILEHITPLVRAVGKKLSGK